MITEKDIKFLYKTADVATKAVESNNHPFGCVVVDDNDNIILESGNLCVTKNNYCAHAESEAAYFLAGKYDVDYLRRCTLYTSVEPCCMCSGTIYWSNIGRIVYGIPETKLLELTGNNEKNQSFNLSCRKVISAGQKDIIVDGPCEDESLINRILEDHKGFWN